MDSKGTPREGKEKKNIRLQQNKEKMWKKTKMVNSKLKEIKSITNKRISYEQTCIQEIKYHFRSFL
jgi:hypothetical protein